MNYLQSFTESLLQLVKKKNLDVWVQNVEMLFTVTSIENGFGKKKIINFVMSEVNVDENTLQFIILLWISKNIPDWDAQGNRPPQMTIIPLDDGNFDIEGVIEFVETTTLVENENGKFLINGVNHSLSSDIPEPFNPVELIVFDSHTQDNGLENE